MWEDFRKFLENQNREGVQVEKVLGNSSKVAKFSQFYERHQEDIAVVTAGSLYNYVTEAQSVSSEEITAFRAGLAQMPLFLEQCYKYTQFKKQEAQKSQSVDEKS